MKLSCKTIKLRQAINKASILASKGTTLPILSSILIVSEEEGLYIRATNLQVGMEIKIDAKIEAPGRLAVSAQLFNGVLSNIKDEDIYLEIIDGTLVVKTNSIVSKLKIVSADDFPSLPKVNPEYSFSIESKTLIEGIRSVSYAALVSDIRPEIASIYVFSDGEALFFVATDSFRLAEKKIDIVGVDSFSGILIPAKNGAELVKVLSEMEGFITVGVNDNQLSVSNDTVYITSRLVEGAFPDYKQIIPNKFNTEVVCLKNDVIGILKMTNIFNDQLNTLRFYIVKDDNKCQLKSINNELGEVVSNLEAKIDGNDISLTINQRYMQDVLGVLNTDSLSMSFVDDLKPMVIQGIGDKTFRYLIMPMKQ